MSDLNLAGQLANELFNRKLTLCEGYLELVEKAFQLRDAAKGIQVAPHHRDAWVIVDDCQCNANSHADILMRLFDRELSELDGALRGYGYQTVFQSDAALIADGRKRIDYLRKGKRFGVYPPAEED